LVSGCPIAHLALIYITKGNNHLTKLPSVPGKNLLRERDGEMSAKVPSAGIYNCIYLSRGKRLSTNQKN
jgi:hypothetical protein